jgi:hypothetical protein
MTMQMSGSGTMRRFVATHRYSRYERDSVAKVGRVARLGTFFEF